MGDLFQAARWIRETNGVLRLSPSLRHQQAAWHSQLNFPLQKDGVHQLGQAPDFLQHFALHLIACSNSIFMLQHTRASDSSSTTRLHEANFLIQIITSWVKVPGPNTWATRPLPHASCAVSFCPLSNISFAMLLPLFWETMVEQPSRFCPKVVESGGNQAFSLVQTILQRGNIDALSLMVGPLTTTVIDFWNCMKVFTKFLIASVVLVLSLLLSFVERYIK